MQDSGCTLLAMALAQLPSTLVVPDLWISSRTPCPQDFRSSFVQQHPNGTIIVKMTMRAHGNSNQALQRLHAIRSAFQPHVVIFFARDCWVNWARLGTRLYANEQGSLALKMQHWDALFAKRNALANATFHFHELCSAPGVRAIASRLRAMGISRDLRDAERLMRFTKSAAAVQIEAIRFTAQFSTMKAGWPRLHYTERGLGSLPGGLVANTSGVGDCAAKIERDWRLFDATTMSASAWQQVQDLAPHAAAFYAQVRREWQAGTLTGYGRDVG